MFYIMQTNITGIWHDGMCCKLFLHFVCIFIYNLHIFFSLSFFFWKKISSFKFILVKMSVFVALEVFSSTAHLR